MFRLTRPSVQQIRSFIESQSRLEPSYRAVGATSAEPPAGYDVDRTRVRLGTGQPVFAAARAALCRWEQFHLGWVEACWPDTPIEVGQTVAVLARSLGLWTLNACRILYVVDETGPVQRFGFAYGTLPAHVESGEERFLVERREEDDSVWYDILAFSRPNHLLTRLGYPVVRRCQRRFARDSANAMARAAGALSGV